MPRYENYTPEIQYNEDKERIESAPADSASSRSSRRAKRKKAQTSSTQNRSQKPSKKAKVSFSARLKEWFTSPQTRIIAGIFMGCVAIYLGASFFSYLSTCIPDQSKIASAPMGGATGISNPGGEGGARLSEWIINEGFGLGSFVIVVWFAAIALKLLVGKPRFRTLDFSIKCMVALITVSLIIGLVTYSTHSTINWGGYHGTYVNEFIINFIGTLGAVLLSIFMIAVFVVICMRDLIKWIMRIRKARAERRRIAEKARAEKEAREAEIRQMKEQEKLDDMRAGETFEIPEVDNTDVADPDDLLEFNREDGKLYEIDSEADNNAPDEPAKKEESDSLNSETDENLNEKASDDGATTENTMDSDTPAEVAADLSSAENNAEQEPPAPSDSDKEKMVVKVNHIASSDKKHFNSEVEMYESHNYKFPPFKLLREGNKNVNIDPEEQLANKRMIEQTLLDFGIPITKIEATVGPTVTLYEIVPDTGVKISKIRSLVDDIALRLSANGVRIIAPIPGKGTVGIEVANKDAQTVSMRTVINSKKFETTRCHLPIAIGSTISNEVYIADLAKMPHLLVAGATGQGKSVGLNAMIASLLYCKAPHEIKFVMIDPKQVEFALYNKLKNHYMAMIPSEVDDEPVITDMSKVEATLSSLCVEMDQRYTLLKQAQTRNIEEYNAKIRQGMLNPRDGHRFLPYIVVIVDEFGDLIMVSGKNVEMPIARLAQKARAVGMHVIIATQRPSTNVITGIIKANFPARISFKVSSGIDSKTILDTSGAQQLIGRGDMLIFNNSEMVRVQCAFIDTPEVEAICEYVEKQPYPSGPYLLPEPVVENQEKGGALDSGAIGERDPLFVEVAKSIVNSNTASTSSVQRHFSVGYVRAGKIMDQLEKAGVVGPSQGGKPRSVLVDMLGLESLLNSLD